MGHQHFYKYFVLYNSINNGPRFCAPTTDRVPKTDGRITYVAYAYVQKKIFYGGWWMVGDWLPR